MSMLLSKMKEHQDYVKQYDPDIKIILFIDEVHKIVSIFGAGSKIGGDLLKTSLAKAEDFIPVISATTPAEYSRYIASDEPLDRRFKRIIIEEISTKQTFDVLRGWLKSVSKDGENLNAHISDELLQYIIDVNKEYNPSKFEPAKSIDILSDVEARSRVRDEPITKMLIMDAFKTVFGISLNFEIDAIKVRDNVRRRVLGQPLVYHEIENMSRRLAFNLDPIRKRPRYTALFPGTTGVGKTETAKAIAEAVYGDEKALIIESMTNYKSEGSDMRFNRILGEKVAYKQDCVILLDELEKAHDDVLNAMLPILDEGELRYIEKTVDGYEQERVVSFKNTIIICTSNAGARALDDIHEYSTTKIEGDEVTLEMAERQRNAEIDVLNALESVGIKPEFLQRFESILVFSTLSEATLRRIAKSMLTSLLVKLRNRGVDVRLPKPKSWGQYGFRQQNGDPIIEDEVTMFIIQERMNSGKSSQSGARKIKTTINREVMDIILKAVDEHKQDGVTKFNLSTKGAMFYNVDDGSSRGRIVANPIE